MALLMFSPALHARQSRSRALRLASLGLSVARQPRSNFKARTTTLRACRRCVEVGKELWVVDRDLMAVIGEKPTLTLESLYNAHEYDEIPDTKFSGFSRGCRKSPQGQHAS